jgi:hypothetical protein
MSIMAFIVYGLSVVSGVLGALAIVAGIRYVFIGIRRDDSGDCL